MHRLPALLLIPLITVAAVPASASAQTLSEIRDQVREPTKAPRSSVVSVGSQHQRNDLLGADIVFHATMTTA